MPTRATPEGVAALLLALCTVYNHRQHAGRLIASNNCPTPLLLNRAPDIRPTPPPPLPQQRAQCPLAMPRCSGSFSPATHALKYHRPSNALNTRRAPPVIYSTPPIRPPPLPPSCWLSHGASASRACNEHHHRALPPWLQRCVQPQS
ncbi:hypothetical protein DL93DRAFT_582365 [Clavulina sp. PMI_390]|nr:hypothetical protein DL93DRAFT_582365 [Clavulina sp. PMI_390]